MYSLTFETKASKEFISKPLAFAIMSLIKNTLFLMLKSNLFSVLKVPL